MTKSATHPQQDSRTRLLDATLAVVRTKGLAAARVEDICTVAGVTKGSFFHHFKSKDELVLAAVEYWDSFTSEFFADADYHRHADPLDRLLGYVDFRLSILEGDVAEFTCFAGTIIQEAYRTQPEIVAACEHNILSHASTLEADIEAAISMHGVTGDWSARSLALHMQSVLQGSFILAKAIGSAKPAAESLAHLRRYLQQLFAVTPTEEAPA